MPGADTSFPNVFKVTSLGGIVGINILTLAAALGNLEDGAGVLAPQEPNVQFANSTITDDPVNSRSIVNIPTGSSPVVNAFAVNDLATAWRIDRGAPVGFTITPGAGGGIACNNVDQEAAWIGGPHTKDMTITAHTSRASGFGNWTTGVPTGCSLGIAVVVSPSNFLLGSFHSPPGAVGFSIIKCVGGVYTALTQNNFDFSVANSSWVVLSKIGNTITFTAYTGDPATPGQTVLTSLSTVLAGSDIPLFAVQGYAGIGIDNGGNGIPGRIDLLRVQ